MSWIMCRNKYRVSQKTSLPEVWQFIRGLVWYKVNIDLGPLSYAGVVSVCENCRKVVEFYPGVSIDNEEVQGQKTDK